MNRLINSRVGSMFLTLMVLSGAVCYAGVEDFQLSVRNLTQPAPNRIEFDVYLLDTDPGQPFELSGCQIGFLLSSLIYNGGVLSVAIDNTGSGLVADQQFTSSPDAVGSLVGYPGLTLIRLAANTGPPIPPGAGSGTVISTTGFGTLLTHFIVTSSVDFTPNSTSDLIFTSGSAVSPLYPTIVNEYIDAIDTQLNVTPGVNAIVNGNPLLNATLPVAFNVTGSGSYCVGGAGLTVGLDDSEIGVTYTLLRDGLDVTTLAGTGNAISFGLRLEGTYTVEGTNLAGTVTMNGQAAITVNPLPTITGVNSGSRCGPGTVILSATASAGVVNWYTNLTGGISLFTGTSFTTPVISTNTSYYVDATSNGCTSPARTLVMAIVNTVPTITGTTPASRCGTGTVLLGATASAGIINWYSDAAGGVSLGTGNSFTTPVISATTTFYVDATNNGCTTAGRTPVIATVLQVPQAAGSITGSATFTPGTAGVPYSVASVPGATGYIWGYSGTGVTINGTGTSVTLDFAANATSGSLSVYGTNTCGQGSAATLTLSTSNKTLTLTSVLLEGLYNASGTMRQAQNATGAQWPAGVADHITVELHNSSNYATIVWSQADVSLSTSGTAVITVPGAYNGSYYITVKHRNSVETTTITPVSFAGTSINRVFGSATGIYGGNLKASGDGYFLMFGGDVNQDGYVDSGDYPDVVNDNFNYISGYLPTDINGDGFIDSGDYPIMVNNNLNYIGTIHP